MRKPVIPSRGHNSGMVWLTRAYNSLDRDPEAAKVAAILRKERIKHSDVAALGALATSTVANLADGKTMRPQHATLAKILGGIGFEYTVRRKEKAPDYTKEIAKAREQRRAYFKMRKHKTKS